MRDFRRGNVLLLMASLAISYVGVETTVRRWGLPDPDLFKDVEGVLATWHQSPAPAWLGSPYGWDRPATVDSARDTAQVGDTTEILLLGDSITRGFGLDRTEAYPTFVYSDLQRDQRVILRNAAVDGFGVDQMILKLADQLADHSARLIIIAYIPHDLLRVGAAVAFGYPKPRLASNRDEPWRVIASEPALPFYDAYQSAKAHFHLSLWSIRQFMANRRYHFPILYRQYYRDQFVGIRDQVLGLARRYDSQVLVVRLASNWPGSGIAVVDSIGTEVFASAPADAPYRYFDSEPCIRRAASAAGIKFEEEFAFHPHAVGHRLYASCLIGPIRDAIGR